MSTELTITISSVEDNPDSTKYKKMSRQRYRVKQPVMQLDAQASQLIRQAAEHKSTSAADGDDEKEMTTQEEATVRTRRGRIVKKPVRYEPIETVTDDFPDSEHSTDYDSEA